MSSEAVLLFNSAYSILRSSQRLIAVHIATRSIPTAERVSVVCFSYSAFSRYMVRLLSFAVESRGRSIGLVPTYDDLFSATVCISPES